MARADPACFVRAGVAKLADGAVHGDATSGGAPSWQATEALLFGATASLEVLLSHVYARDRIERASRALPASGREGFGTVDLSARDPRLLAAYKKVRKVPFEASREKSCD